MKSRLMAQFCEWIEQVYGMKVEDMPTAQAEQLEAAFFSGVMKTSLLLVDGKLSEDMAHTAIVDAVHEHMFLESERAKARQEEPGGSPPEMFEGDVIVMVLQ